MCTVTYIPYGNGYILSSNRDESPLRAQNPLIAEVLNDQKVLFPRDTKGGSWLFASDKKETVCVLNGAHLKHKHRPPYKASRGIIARSYFDYEDPKSFMKSIDLKGIEPFTMIMAGMERLYVFRWNEREKHIDILDRQKPHIWSSSTLYTPEMANKRKNWFVDYLKAHPSFTLEDIHYIHRNGSVGDPMQDYVMNRQNIVCTVSISHVIVREEEITFEFENLLDGNSEMKKISSSIVSSH